MAHSGKLVSATGDVSTGPTQLWAVSTSLTAAGTLELRNGGAGGALLASLAAATAGHYPIPFGLRFSEGLHVTFADGAAGDVTFWL